jgi:hypothetical protein
LVRSGKYERENGQDAGADDGENAAQERKNKKRHFASVACRPCTTMSSIHFNEMVC